MSYCYAIFSARFYPCVGGVESFSQNLARTLACRGNKVHVVTSRLDSSPTHEFLSDGVEVWRMPAHSFMHGRLPIARHNRRWRKLRDELASCAIDRVLVNTRFYTHSIDGLRFAQYIDAPVLVLDHGSAPLTLGNSLADAGIWAYERRITRRGQRYHPRYAGISAASAHWLATFGIKTSSIVPNAIDAASFCSAASNRNFRRELGLAEDTHLVVSVGRLTPEKGADRFLDIAQILGDGWEFALAGNGALRSSLAARASSHIHLLGELNHADLSALLKQADAFCLPTRSEGFCTSLLEAGAWGLFSVIPHVGGSDEVLGSDERFGTIVPSREPATMAQALREAALVGRLGHSEALAMHVQQRCSWEHTIELLERAYTS